MKSHYFLFHLYLKNGKNNKRKKKKKLLTYVIKLQIKLITYIHVPYFL